MSAQLRGMELRIAEDMTSVLDHVSRVQIGLEDGSWHYVADKAVELAGRAQRLADAVGYEIDNQNPRDAARPSTIDVAIRRFARHYRAGRALYPERIGSCSAPNRERDGSCIRVLAAGWHGTSDLCPGCTRRFMQALDGIEPGLEWHSEYQSRAVDRIERIGRCGLMGTVYCGPYTDAIGHHEGYAAQLLPDGTESSCWVDYGEFRAFQARCDCGWVGTAKYSPTEAGAEQALTDWWYDHLNPLIDAEARRHVVSGEALVAFTRALRGSLSDKELSDRDRGLLDAVERLEQLLDDIAQRRQGR